MESVNTRGKGNDMTTYPENEGTKLARRLTFGEVIEGLKIGRRYTRSGWNGKDMFIFLVPGSVFKVNREPLLSIMGAGTEVAYHPHIDMKLVSGTIVPWTASQMDMLATDWMEVR